MEKNKYSSVSCKCNNGHIHKSRVEASDCDKLNLMIKEKGSKYHKVDNEVKFSLDINGNHICNHYMDHVLRSKTKGVKDKAVETKGFKTGVWALKRKLFKAMYPDYDYEVWYH